jgi:cephalosporin hydroxylase
MDAKPSQDAMNGDQKPQRLVQGRSFVPAVGHPLWDMVQMGTMRTVYKGIHFFKSPFDIALYLQLISKLRPASVIEVGTAAGGSAIWFADMLTAHGVQDPRIISIDKTQRAVLNDARVTFLECEAQHLENVLEPELVATLPRPLLVVEDSSHLYPDVIALLQYFHPLLKTGDYIVVEDGILAVLSNPLYLRYDNGPNRAVADFLALFPHDYCIDSELCDFYGQNMTYNPNGWLRRL